jgi:hypothetical protein
MQGMRTRTSIVRRRLWTTAVSVAVAVAAIALAGLPVYVFPPVDPVTDADLIYVIGPPTEGRIALEERLRGEGVADSALVSVPLDGEQSAANLGICEDAAVDCEHPEPFTTKGEAAMLAAYAPAHDVDRTIVITFTPHVARTRYIFDKCYPGEVTVVGLDEHLSLADWAYQYAYQSVGFVKAWMTRCSDADDP